MKIVKSCSPAYNENLKFFRKESRHFKWEKLRGRRTEKNFHRNVKLSFSPPHLGWNEMLTSWLSRWLYALHSFSWSANVLIVSWEGAAAVAEPARIRKSFHSEKFAAFHSSYWVNTTELYSNATTTTTTLTFNFHIFQLASTLVRHKCFDLQPDILHIKPPELEVSSFHIHVFFFFGREEDEIVGGAAQLSRKV